MLLPLSNTTMCAIIDDDDYDRLKDYTWHLNQYVLAPDKKDNYRMVRLHRVVMGIPIGSSIHVHHKNGNTLDNRKANLQRVTNSRHGRLSRRQEYATLKEWARSNGYKSADTMSFQWLQSLKAQRDSEHTARILREGANHTLEYPRG